MDTSQHFPCPQSPQSKETHALCDILQVVKLGGPEGPWPDSGRREGGPESQGPVTLGSQQDEVTLVNTVT